VRLARTIAVLALPALAACHVVKYDAGLRPGPRRYERSVNFFFWGLAPRGGATIDLDEACPEGVARWREQASFGDVIVDVVTLGVWTPRTVIVQCAEARR
jgi:hypothetical protein